MKTTKLFLINLLIIVPILLLGTGLFADFTPLINYQGKLQENDVPVNETLNMEFKIFDSLSGGNQLWSSGVVSVSVNNGIFNYILGMNNGAAFALIDWSKDRWIEVDIDGETLAPREQLTGVPYSLMSRDLVLTNNKTIKNTWVTNGAQIKGTAILGTTLPGLHAHSHSPGQSDALEANSIVASNIASLKIPAGTAVNVSAVSNIGIDTTADQFIYYGTDKRVLTYVRTKSVTIEDPADTDNFLLWKTPYPITITAINGIVDPADTGESVVITIEERDGTGDNPAGVDGATTITCDNDGATDDGSLSNGQIDAGDWISIDIGTVTGTVTQVSVTISYIIDVQ